MCNTDYEWEPISERWRIIRKPRECASCMRTYPTGTRMLRLFGTYEGEPQVNYACEACEVALIAAEHSTMHLCWGWAWSDGDDRPYGEAELVHAYIKRALQSDGPSEVECQRYVHAGLVLAEMDDSDLAEAYL